jgi:hypothetical protein
MSARDARGPKEHEDRATGVARAQQTIAPAFKTAARFVLVILGFMAFATAVLIARYVYFEYRYGDPQHVHALLDKVLP